MTSQERDYWRERWLEGRTGWHESDVNAALRRHYDAVLSPADHATARPGRILVPLCGKSVDLTWLAHRGHEVVGIEFVEEAARGYFVERGLYAVETQSDGHLLLSAGGVTIVVGDVLTVGPSTAGLFDLLYDRGAVVALKPDLRARYYGVIQSLVAPGATGLVVAFEYDKSIRSGPPFSVPQHELQTGWPNARIEILGSTQEQARSAPPSELTETSYQVNFGQ